MADHRRSSPLRSIAVSALVAGCLLASPVAATSPQSRQSPPFPSSSVTVDLREVPVRDVLRWIADETGANLVLSDAVGGTVTLALTDVDIAVLFREVLLAAGLGWCVVGDTVEVGTRCP